MAWTGEKNNLFSNTENYNTTTWNFVFNNTSATRTLIYLDKNYTGSFKFGENTSRYRGLIFRAHPAASSWHLCGWYDNAIHSYDNSGGSGEAAAILIADADADSTLRLSAISLTTKSNQVGRVSYGYAGHVVMDEYDADGTTWRGPVTFKNTGDMRLYKGDLYATNAVLTCGGKMYLYDFTTEITGGSLTANQIYVGNAANKTATLIVNGGTVANSSGALYVSYVADATGYLYLNGGTVVTRNLYKQNGTGTVVFNGGTLQSREAYANYGGIIGTTLAAKVGANGGTIHTGELAITLGTGISDLENESGGMTFKGGGSVAITAAQSYTGGTTVEAGTILKLNTAAKTSIAAHVVYVDVSSSPADGTEAIEITDDGTFTAEEFARMSTIGDAQNRYALELRESGTKVVIVDTQAGEYVWNGGNSGNSWKTAGVWTKNGTAGNWYDSVAAVFETAGDAAMVDSDVTAESIAFRANATVTGSGTLTVPSVSVVSGVSATISAPTAGALEKTGPGALTLGASRTAATTLTEGTLALSGSGQTTAWSNLAFGTGNAVTLSVASGATLSHGSDAALYIGSNAGQDVTLSIDAGGTVEARNLFYGSGTGTVVFNGGTLKSNTDYAKYGGLIGSELTVTITGNGGTIGNGGHAILVSKDLAGAMTFTGSGTTTVAVDQSATGSMTVAGGTVAINDTLTIARAVTVEDGATLKASGAATFSGALTFEAGATLDVSGATAVAASATLPASGSATLTMNGGAFAKGLYPILTATGISATDFEGVLVPSLASGLTAQYCVKGDTLYLAVGIDMTGNVWTGGAGDGLMSTPGNWWSGRVPSAGDAVDFSAVLSAVSITADIDATFGAVTMGEGVVTFSESFAAASFSDTTKIAVAANATVTIEGDFAPSGDVVYSVAAGGKFVVTGTLTLGTWAKPQVSPGGGTIAAGGITAAANAVMVASNEEYAQKWAVGPGGITGGAYLWTYSNPGAAAEFRPWTGDFTISVGSVFRNNANSFTLNTTGLDGNGHTITLAGGFADGGDPLNVTGAGKVVVDHVTAAIGNFAAYSGAVEVKDTATLAINAGKKLTTGAISVGSGATLEVAGSGAVALGGDLSLADGATLKFTFTERKNPPVLDLTDKAVTFGDQNEIKISLSGVHPVHGTDGIYYLTKGGGFADATLVAADQPRWVKSIGIENGKIYAMVQAAGLAIMIW